ncbi:MAG TPA: hypothetical protein ENJ46_00445 [Hellea balneolensis]|uniref:Uncharacterized protein n=1 Tax=Hellea balneolensis TaxID=287478 RepID=A0A7C3C4F7_9PROT|nr:hypothetical protein [Hellea balneolensis]
MMTPPRKKTEKQLPTLANINSEHIANAAATPQVWFSYGGTYDEQRYSRLKMTFRFMRKFPHKVE